MNPETPDAEGPRRRASSVSAGSDRYEALLEVLEQQADLAAHDSHQRPRRSRTGWFKGASPVLLLGASVWLWVLPPAWLIPPPPPPQPVAEEEAALRFTMYLQAQRIRAYELEHGLLPESLVAAGQSLPGMTYVMLGPDLYELTGTTERVRITYRSDEPLREWVGSGADVLDESMLP